MKKALISSIEPVESGYRVAQVEFIENTFDVAKDLFWFDCDDTVVADQFWFDPSDESIKPIPTQTNTSTPEVTTQTQGTQEF